MFLSLTSIRNDSDLTPVVSCTQNTVASIPWPKLFLFRFEIMNEHHSLGNVCLSSSLNNVLLLDSQVYCPDLSFGF